MVSLHKSWYSILPGTNEQFYRFIGHGHNWLKKATWVELSDMMTERFKMYPLGGGVRFPGSEIEQKTFRFQLPNRNLWWRAGVPSGGARIDAAREGMRIVQGTGDTIDQAALNAILALWELTWLRARGAK